MDFRSDTIGCDCFVLLRFLDRPKVSPYVDTIVVETVYYLLRYLLNLMSRLPDIGSLRHHNFPSLGVFGVQSHT